VAAAVERVPRLVGAGAPPVLAGHSAGGQLALWCASQPNTRALGVLALAPVADLALAYRLGLGGGAVAAFLGGGPADVPDRYSHAQPGRPTVPAVIVHGTDDNVVPVDVSRAYAGEETRLEKTRLIELPGVDHFALIDPYSAVWSVVLGALGVIGT